MVTNTGKLLCKRRSEVFLTGTAEEFPVMLQRWLATSEESSKPLYLQFSKVK